MSASPQTPRLLILGATGFIGRRLMQRAQAMGLRVLGTHSGRCAGHLPVFRLGRDRLSRSAAGEFLNAEGPCWIVQAAGFGSVDACRQCPEESRLVNVEAIQSYMNELRGGNVRHVFLSSSYVFDGQEGNYGEASPCRPLNLYGLQKREMELWMSEYEPDSLILRLDKIVGADPRDDHLFSQWRRQVLEKQPLVCIKDLYFSPTLVDDVVEGILTACRLGLRGLYHVSAGAAYGREELARKFLSVIDGDAEIVVKPQSELGLLERRPQRTHLDGGRFRSAAGVSFTPMEAAIATFAARSAASNRPGRNPRAPHDRSPHNAS